MSLPKPISGKSANRMQSTNLERRNSTSVAERKVPRPQIKPALYATPESTPLPDAPSSFPPSPYIINHKRRGPRLVKSFSVDDVSIGQKIQDAEKGNVYTKDMETTIVKSFEASATFAIADVGGEEWVNSDHICASTESQRGNSNDHLGNSTSQLVDSNVEEGSSSLSNDLAIENNLKKFVVSTLMDDGENENSLDLQDSVSFISNRDGEGSLEVESSGKINVPIGEFFDAPEELSSDGPQVSVRDVEFELREVRLGLLMETEKRKQAEESLSSVQNHWHKISEHLALVGLMLPLDPIAIGETEQVDDDHLEDLCKQVCVARFVSNSIGRGISMAKMEVQIESKNFEIARLWERLHYYEAVNYEMSQRNQEAVEMSRRERLKRKRRQKWIWGSVAAAIMIGTSALAWSYLPSVRGSSSPKNLSVPDLDD